MDAPSTRFRLTLPLAYLMAGIAWILGPDALSGQADIRAAGQLAASLGGIAFVIISAALLYAVQGRPAATLRTTERFPALNDTSPVGIFRVDLAGQLVFANPRAGAITGLDLGASLALGWLRAVHADDRPGVTGTWRRYVESAGRLPCAVEFRVLRPDGSTTWVLSEVTPERGRDGRLVGHLGTITDITAIKQAQLELQQAHDLLEQRVRERTQQLEAARAAAELSDRVKSAFLSTMSHELRTPLNSILGFTDVLLQQLPGPLTAEQERQLRFVRDASTHLRSLVEDVLDVSRIEAGQVGLDYEDVDVRDLVVRQVETFGAIAARKRVTLRVLAPEDLPMIRSDRRRVAQIVGKLVSNAVKFTDAGEVSVALDASDAGVEIAVIDTGVGIPEPALREIFNPFVQVARPGGRLHDGTGLGLAISRNLARALGGDITVQSELGRGSRFTLRLPTVTAVAA